MGIVIGLAGRKQSGKSTLARRLVDFHAFNEIALADPIRWMLEPLIDSTSQSTFGDWYEHLYLDKEKPIAELYGLSGRFLMQQLGTEWGRKCIHPDLWVDITLKRIEQSPSGLNWVIPDVRFKNEVDRIRKAGGFTIWVERGQCDLSDNHASERSLTAADTNHVIVNNFPDPDTFAENGAGYIMGLLS